MKHRIAHMYLCEVCGKESENKSEIANCESGHYGLTCEEKVYWDELKNKKAYYIGVAKYGESYDKDFYEKKLSSVTKELEEFEKSKGLVNQEG